MALGLDPPGSESPGLSRFGAHYLSCWRDWPAVDGSNHSQSGDVSEQGGLACPIGRLFGMVNFRL